MSTAARQLRREVGLLGAILLGLGSIVGTGVFVGVGLVVEKSGSAIHLALVLAGLIAISNGLNSAQLAANFPVSGGTYEYAYRLLHPWAGVTAGWLFLWAKSASAATAALGVLGYVMTGLGWDFGEVPYRVGAATLTLLITSLVAAGVRRSNKLNAVLVFGTLGVLLCFVGVGLIPNYWPEETTVTPSWNPSGLFEATALLFVAYTGYGRIATLGEEVENPRTNIPLAVIWTLSLSWLLYALVGWVVSLHLSLLEATSLPLTLESIAMQGGATWLPGLVLLGALTAMLGVLLNLVLGLSRVVLAMARRNDMPGFFSYLDHQENPTRAVWLVGGIIASLCLLGEVGLTWSLSAVTVLLYYGLTNLAAARLSEEQRIYPRWLSVLGLVGCLFLSLWIEMVTWAIAVSLWIPSMWFSWWCRQVNK